MRGDDRVGALGATASDQPVRRRVAQHLQQLGVLAGAHERSDDTAARGAADHLPGRGGASAEQSTSTRYVVAVPAGRLARFWQGLGSWRFVVGRWP